MLNKVNYKCLKNINICVFDNEITAIIGSNGSGKSLLAEIISTLRKPTSGKFIIDKNEIDFKNEFLNYNALRFDIGIVLQNVDNHLFQDTVKEHILFQLTSYNYKVSDKRVISSLKMVGLDDSYLDKKLNTLSNGEKYLVALAGVLSYNPKLIILDDPTSFIDKKSESSLIKLLRQIKSKYSKTILVVSSNTNFIHSIADYVYIISKGKIVEHGTKYKIFNKDIEKYGLEKPDIIKFCEVFESKTKVNIERRDDINDLIKDIYFCVEKRGSI